MIIIECVEDGYDEDYLSMEGYISKHGCHFNDKLADLAIEYIKEKHPGFVPWKSTEVDQVLKEFNIVLNNNKGHDYVYVANMCKDRYFGKSIPTKEYVAKFIRDEIDGIGAYEGSVFNRWYADMRKLNHQIAWKDME